MTVTQFDEKHVLGKRITEMNRQELCEFASRLCGRIVAEVGTRGRRGGIYPDNISLDEENNIGIGPSRESPWEGEELKYIAPEQYWNGKIGAASDVYSVGLLLYYAVSGGKLPMEDECRDAQLRRMGGDNYKAPRAAGRRLGEIIEKATRFKPEERYRTLEELRVALDSCVKNLYLNGAPSAEVIFKKSDDELSDVERMMIGIMEREEHEEETGPEEELPAAPAAEEEGVRLYEPESAKTEAKPSAPDGRVVIPRLREEKNPELAPVVPAAANKASAQYMKNAERERKINEEVRKRRRRPLAVILVLCAILVVVAIVFNAILRDYQQARQMPDSSIAAVTPNPDADPYLSMPDPNGADNDVSFVNGALAPIGGEQQEETNEPANTPREHGYDIFVEDISWTEARDKCAELGGRLVSINSPDEFNTVVDLMIAEGVDKAWIGLHRVDGTLIWEDGEQGYMQWTRGEPTEYDYNDDVAEDYVMLWNHNGWGYNDNRNDPVADYPEWYSGTIAYICEYGN